MEISEPLLGALGLKPKTVPIYRAVLSLGQGTIQQISKVSGIKRTTIYYILPSLLQSGVLIETRRNNRLFYIAELPEKIIKRAQERLTYAEKTFTAPRIPAHAKVYFLYGPSGFKQIWEKIFAEKSRTYRIITDGSSFLDFVKEKYILKEIIDEKRKKGISSRQIIVDSPYARSIVAKDSKENRVSKFLPRHSSLPFTQVIGDSLTAFISPRFENTLFIIENEAFAETHRTLFEKIWETLPGV